MNSQWSQFLQRSMKAFEYAFGLALDLWIWRGLMQRLGMFQRVQRLQQHLIHLCRRYPEELWILRPCKRLTPPRLNFRIGP